MLPQSKPIKKDYVAAKNTPEVKKEGKTEFKKTGRNKYLQEKRNAKFGRKPERRPEPAAPER